MSMLVGSEVFERSVEVIADLHEALAASYDTLWTVVLDHGQPNDGHVLGGEDDLLTGQHLLDELGEASRCLLDAEDWHETILADVLAHVMAHRYSETGVGSGDPGR
jgi:hypothetical protein